MTLVNGSGYSISDNTGTRNSGDNGTNYWCYGDNSQLIDSFAVKWYLNDLLLHTNTSTDTKTVYPIMAQYFNLAAITLTQNSSSIVSFTLPAAFFQGDSSTKLGVDRSTASSSYYTMDYAFDIEISSGIVVLDHCSVDGPSVKNLNIALNTDDVLKLELGEITPPSGNGNITFPQVPEPRSIKNSAFKS